MTFFDSTFGRACCWDLEPRHRGGARPRSGRSAWLAAPALLLWLAATQAGVFRYQDAQGLWHFTDDPPAKTRAELVPGYNQDKPESMLGDLTTQLESGLEATTPIGHASLAVVTIKSGSGVGSGFFCTREGHILTSRRLVRPSEGTELQAREESVEGQRQELLSLQQALEEDRTQLKLMQKDLEGYERVIKGAQDDTTRDWAKETHARLSEEHRAAKAKLTETKNRLDAVKQDLRRNRRDMNLERNSEAVRTSFDLVVKDGTELTATLVGTSAEHDLALLQVEGVRTPYLRPADPQTLTQGQRVFALGHSTGTQDSTPSGVITGMPPELVHTSIQIGPGTSGGPLVTEDGEVVGINIAKDPATGSSAPGVGLGEAIPIESALSAFPQILE